MRSLGGPEGRAADPSSRRETAIARVMLAVARLRDLGVDAKVIGSLARGTFSTGSDVDLLILSCPARLKYAIEGRVEDCLEGIPFDVVYLDEIPPERRERFTRDAVDADRLSPVESTVPSAVRPLA